jgi:hypothetical protein
MPAITQAQKPGYRGSCSGLDLQRAPPQQQGEILKEDLRLAGAFKPGVMGRLKQETGWAAAPLYQCRHGHICHQASVLTGAAADADGATARRATRSFTMRRIR